MHGIVGIALILARATKELPGIFIHKSKTQRAIFNTTCTGSSCNWGHHFCAILSI